MTWIDNPQNDITISKLLEEMNLIEGQLSNWGCYWSEYYDQKFVLPEGYKIMPVEDKEQLSSYTMEGYIIDIRHDKMLLPPIKSVQGCAEYGICTVFLVIPTNHCQRKICFKNNGSIELNKYDKGNRSKGVTYNLKYNVVSDDCELKMTEVLNSGCGILSDYRHYTVQRQGNIIIKRYNDVEIRFNLRTKQKVINIYTRKRSRNGNGKIKWMDRLYLSNGKVEKIIHYSRKGKKTDVTETMIDYYSIEMFEGLENKIDMLLRQVKSELPSDTMTSKIDDILASSVIGEKPKVKTKI